MNLMVPNNYAIYVAFVLLFSMLLLICVSDENAIKFIKLKWQQNVNSANLPAIGSWVSADNTNQNLETHRVTCEEDLVVEEL